MSTTTAGERVDAFVPSSLPPDPPIDWNPSLREKYEKATLLLGRLDSVSILHPETSLFLYMYIRKEAVLSSMIEGTQSSLSDLLLFEFDHKPGVPIDDVQEVSNYIAALEYGLQRFRDGFPLSNRLIREIHSILFSKGRGSQKSPSEFRRSQNWIGGTRPGNAKFVPPPPEMVAQCMGELELFIHDEPEKSPSIIKAALVHIQFETVHPFLDGNGRLGRLLIILLFCAENVLREPLLYLSLYFKSHRQKYYNLLDQVRQTGDWESWLDFFFDAIIAVSNQAVEAARNLRELVNSDQAKIKELAKASNSLQLVHRVLAERPIATPKWLAEHVELSIATINSSLRELEEIGIIEELTGKKRNRIYSYSKYLHILNEGTELPES